MVTKGSIHQVDITVNAYAPNIKAPEYIKQKLTELKGEINSSTIITGDFTIPASTWIDNSDRESIRKTADLNNIIEQMDLTDI